MPDELKLAPWEEAALDRAERRRHAQKQRGSDTTTIKGKAFDESKHPRGQPGNPGQFGPGGGNEPEQEKPKTESTEHKPEDASPKKSSIAHGKIVRVGVFLRFFSRAVASAPAKVKEHAEKTTIQARQRIDGTLDKVLSKALPADAAEETRNAVVSAVLSTVQESILGSAFADAPQATPTTWREDMMVKIGPYAITRAAFSLCKKFKTQLCSKLAKALP